MTSKDLTNHLPIIQSIVDKWNIEKNADDQKLSLIYLAQWLNTMATNSRVDLLLVAFGEVGVEVNSNHLTKTAGFCLWLGIGEKRLDTGYYNTVLCLGIPYLSMVGEPNDFALFTPLFFTNLHNSNNIAAVKNLISRGTSVFSLPIVKEQADEFEQFMSSLMKEADETTN